MFNDSHILFFHSIFKYMGLYELSMEAVSQNLWWISTIPKKKKVESIQTVWRTQLSKRQQFFTGIHFLLNDSHMLFLTAFSSTKYHLSWTYTLRTTFKAVGNMHLKNTGFHSIFKSGANFSFSHLPSETWEDRMTHTRWLQHHALPHLELK